MRFWSRDLPWQHVSKQARNQGVTPRSWPHPKFSKTSLVVRYNKFNHFWILSSQMTKTFRDNCVINIVQQTNCEPLFPVVQMQLKTYFFVPFVRPCMHLNYCVISGSHACRDCGWHIILVAEYLFLERCRKSNNIWLRALMLSDCLYSSLFFEHCNHIYSVIE